MSILNVKIDILINFVRLFIPTWSCLTLKPTTTNLTFCDIEFSVIKKMPLIHIFSIIIIDFYFKFHYKVI